MMLRSDHRYGIGEGDQFAARVAAKHGVVGTTKGLPAELGADGTTIDAIGPGHVATEINKATMADERFNHLVFDRTPLGRWASPDELAGPTVFLASSAAAFVSGHFLMVDGGMSATIFQTESTDRGLGERT
jgi:gluconate 5-dehydrogenase